MERNKFIFAGDTLLDLSGDTVTASSMVSGTTAHDKAANPIVGSLVIQGFHVVSQQPTSVINGDLYFLV